MDQDLRRAERQQLMRAAVLLAGALVAAPFAWAAAPVAWADEPSAVAPGHVPEPVGLHQGAMHGYTPNTIKGGTVVDTAGVVALIDAHALLLDVAEKDRRPPNMAKTMIWLPNHRSISGAIFLQGGGKGDPDPAFDEAFRTRVAALTGGDKAKPIVTFCHPDCWGSWNAAKRLIEDGYTHVSWYPEGIEGWQAADHSTSLIKPDAAWVESLPKDATQ